MANDSITLPGWFRWFLGLVLVGGVPWCSFVSMHVAQVPSIARAVERNNVKSDENSKSAEVGKSQYSELNRRMIRMEDKIDQLLKAR